MKRITRSLSLCALAASATLAGDAAVAQQPQVTFYQQRIVIRVPRMSPPASTAAVWKEKKGPKCLPPRELAGAMISGPSAVDLLMTDGRRMRARLGKDCRGINFYSDLYLKPGPDGRVCAERDAFRVRSGARCQIDDFRKLTLKR